jgi:hypothetical protein
MKAQRLEDQNLAQVEAGAQSLATAFSAILQEPVLLGRFLRACAILKSLDSQARAAAVRILEQGDSISGVDYHTGRVLTSVPAEAVLQAAESNGRLLENLKALVYLLAPFNKSEYAQFCRKVGATVQLNHDWEQTGTPYVVVSAKGAK